MDIDDGPLAGLLGTWRGDQGLDISPEPDGSEANPFYETITFEAAGAVTIPMRTYWCAVRDVASVVADRLELDL